MAKVQGYTARVPGHTLDREAQRPWGQWGPGPFSVSCSCGARKRVESTGQGKRWHREHKAEVVAAQSS